MGRTARNGQDGSLHVAGRYRLVEKLGTGGMSVVWRGYDEVLGRAVAVKVLSPRLAGDQTFRDRLRQEALAAARLCHPHITGIFDFGEYPFAEGLTVPYVVMELNDGETVAARIGRQGTLAWREAVTIAAEVASALATAHARGLVHRDVTPANVMLTAAGAKVVDFGISAVVGQRDAAPDGSLLGTPAYLAPERLGGAQVSAATDVYALGLLLYRSLSGRLPWPAETTAEALRAHLYADPSPLPSTPGLPAIVGELCLRCLAKNPSDRPAAAEVAQTLAATVGMQPIIPPLNTRAPAEAALVRGAAAVPAVVAARPRVGLRRSALAYLGLPGSLRPASLSPGSLPPGILPSGLRRSGGSPDAGPLDGPTGSSAPGLVADAAAASGRRLVDGGPAGVVRPTAVPPTAGVLRLRAGLRIATALKVGGARPLGGGLFVGGRLVQETFRGLLSAGSLTGRHRIQAALVTIALLTVAGVGWSAAREAPEVEQAQAAGAGPAAEVPKGTACAVRYQLKRDSGTDYEAQLTVATTDDLESSAWRVQFSYAGSQQLTGSPKAVTQKGRRVVVKGRGKLQAFTLRGDYRGLNALPFSFTLDGHKCRAEVLGSSTAGRTEDDGSGTAVSEAAGPDKKQTSRGQGGGTRPSKKTAPAPSSSGKPVTVPSRGQVGKPSPTVQVPARKTNGFSLAL